MIECAIFSDDDDDVLDRRGGLSVVAVTVGGADWCGDKQL
jgi:hypothetical protein